MAADGTAADAPLDLDHATATLQGQLAGVRGPARVPVLLELAHACTHYGRALEAQRHIEEAYALAPDDPAVQRRMGLGLIREGDWRRGLELYDAGRWSLPEMAPILRPFPHASWQGGPAKGKRLLLWAEQGIGDQIMQARVLGDLQARGARVTLEADPRIAPLIDRSFPGIPVVPQTVTPAAELMDGAFDAQGSLFSAWRWSEPCLAERPHPAYLVAPPERVADYRRTWNALGWHLNVGLSWHSGAARTGAGKSIDVALLEPLLAHRDVAFHCLQYDVDAEALAGIVRRVGHPIRLDSGGDARRDIDRLAAQIAALDLVVSIDNATFHLAGAVGTPCWTLLRSASDWRWGLDRSDTRLYAGMRLFRGRHAGHWGDVVIDLAGAFDTWVGERR
jgi:hypothetical protein